MVVSATESKPPAAVKHSLKRKIDDVNRYDDATFSVRSPVDENVDGHDDDDDDDDKENAVEKRIPGESKLSRGNREADKIFPLQQRTRANRSPRPPRPANAFMLFANEWRKKLAAENPRESNKDISVRLVFPRKRRPPLVWFTSSANLNKELTNPSARETISREITAFSSERSRDFATCCTRINCFTSSEEFARDCSAILRLYYRK